jgi:hypothetical protein
MLPSLSHLSLDVANTSLVPPTECPICYEELYTCGPVDPSLEPPGRLRRFLEYVTREDQWPQCKHYRWKADQPVMILTCGHYMHTDCLMRWFRRSQVCPVCREPIDLQQLGDALNIRFIKNINDLYAFDKKTSALRFILLQDGMVFYYEGDQGQERRVRTEDTGGYIEYYEGDQGQERLVQKEDANGNTYYYEGDKGQERRVRIKYANGHIEYFERDQG